MTANEATNWIDLIKDIFSQIDKYLVFGLVAVFAIMTILQFSKSKWSPWSALLAAFGKSINHELYEKLDTVKNELSHTRKDFAAKTLSDTRRYIFDFANACRHGKKHTRSQWEFVISEIDNYEKYIEENDLKNGVFKGEANYLRRLFQQLLSNNEFLSSEWKEDSTSAM